MNNNKKTKFKYTLKFPTNIREFNEHEIEYLKNFKFGKKSFDKVSEKFSLRLRTLISIIEYNKKDKNGYVHIPAKFIRTFCSNSQKTADRITKAALGSIIETDNHYDTNQHVSKGYRLKQEFIYCGLHSFKKGQDTVDSGGDTTDAPDETKEASEEPTNIIRFMKDGHINKEDRDIGNDDDTLTAKAVIRKFNTAFYHGRIRNIGIDPKETSKCSCCGNDIPNYLFSIRADNSLNTKCRICYKLEEGTVQHQANDEQAIEVARKLVDFMKWRNLPRKKRREIKSPIAS